MRFHTIKIHNDTSGPIEAEIDIAWLKLRLLEQEPWAAFSRINYDAMGKGVVTPINIAEQTENIKVYMDPGDYAGMACVFNQDTLEITEPEINAATLAPHEPYDPRFDGVKVFMLGSEYRTEIEGIEFTLDKFYVSYSVLPVIELSFGG